MKPLPLRSPFDGGEIVVTRFYCPGSDISVEGRFAVAIPFAQLSPEQLRFIETFVRCEGKLSRMEDEMGLSYPTLRSRLHDIIRALGYEPGREEGPAVSEDARRAILNELDQGKITFEQAMGRLQGDEA
ncbi:MAG: DUF2089 domain-containing protein [Caldilineaceae bacterium]|nr:DUF2089 domain-containing protein [Caldilineaceae bacterium]